MTQTLTVVLDNAQVFTGNPPQLTVQAERPVLLMEPPPPPQTIRIPATETTTLDSLVDAVKGFAQRAAALATGREPPPPADEPEMVEYAAPVDHDRKFRLRLPEGELLAFLRRNEQMLYGPDGIARGQGPLTHTAEYKFHLQASYQGVRFQMAGCFVRDYISLAERQHPQQGTFYDVPLSVDYWLDQGGALPRAEADAFKALED